MRRRGGYCPDGCIGGGAFGHHPMCPSAPCEPDHEDECLGANCPGHFLVSIEQDEEVYEDCPCLCHKEPDDGL